MALLRRLNDLPVFDPSRWSGREAVARVVGTVACAAYLVRSVLLIPSFPGFTSDAPWLQEWFEKLTFVPPNLIGHAFPIEEFYGYYGYSPQEIRLLWWLRLLVWLLGSAVLLGYIAAFLTRVRSKSVAKGFMEGVFPLLISGLPFLIAMTEPNFDEWMPPESRGHLGTHLAVLILLVLGTSLNVAGLFALRRSFTIMAEARALVRTGPYRSIRHPLYTSHFVVFLANTLVHFHLSTIALYVVFVAGQVVRARMEERKLVATFPEYEEYRRTTGMFLPRPGLPAAGAPSS
jgi:protein-S-isoprenylcysteine O-methyltransferase Ste14